MYFSATLALATGALCLGYPEQEPLIGHSGKYSVQTPPLDTPWTYEVGTDNPWPQYPRPKLVRYPWQSLNGIWTWARASGHSELSTPPFNETLSREVLVPFCLESGLSGIQESNTIYSWYRTTFTVPSNWTGDRVLLNFGAVDYEATVFVNERIATFHRGGYFAFSIDMTDYLNDGENELYTGFHLLQDKSTETNFYSIVFAFDPTDKDTHVIPLGKQTLDPSHIFYRPCSGIWQSVWLESAPSDHISDLSIDGDANGQVKLTVSTSGSNNSSVEVTVYERGTNNSVATHNGTAGSRITFNVSSPRTWSPDSPNLYDVTIKMGQDLVSSYIGFRTVTREEVNGVSRILLNGEVIFPFGTLDHGYWPDGLQTPPTYEAMTFDIKTLKRIGFNMLRKHVKVEPALYYAAADELGILIMQDMPCLRPSRLPDKAQQAEFERQLEIFVVQLRSYSSIFAWSLYNEGWGQIDADRPEIALTDLVSNLDPTRLVNSVSGWIDHGAGDFKDTHSYTESQCGISPDRARIGFQGEFGGTGHNVSAEHLWKVKQAIDAIDQTYELYETVEAWNFRGHFLLSKMLLDTQLYACAGGVWTQTTDVEGEINGMLTYDRRVLRPDVEKWRADIQALYNASTYRSNSSTYLHLDL